MFDRAPKLPVDLIPGLPYTSAPQNQLEYSRRTLENLQPAYEWAHRDRKEGYDKQAVSNESLSSPSFKYGYRVLFHRPYHGMDGPNAKLRVLAKARTVSERNYLRPFIASPNAMKPPTKPPSTLVASNNVSLPRRHLSPTSKRSTACFWEQAFLSPT